MNKKIIYEIKGMYRDDFRITGYEFGEGAKSVCIVGSSRGNEVQQIYCCSLLVKKLRQLEEEGRIRAGHKILVIPSMNPYSMNIQNGFGRRIIRILTECFRGIIWERRRRGLRTGYLRK